MIILEKDNDLNHSRISTRMGYLEYITKNTVIIILSSYDETLNIVCFVTINDLWMSCQCHLTSIAGQPPVVARIVPVQANPCLGCFSTRDNELKSLSNVKLNLVLGKLVIIPKTTSHKTELPLLTCYTMT